jgi:hypothetical protein
MTALDAFGLSFGQSWMVFYWHNFALDAQTA